MGVAASPVTNAFADLERGAPRLASGRWQQTDHTATRVNGRNQHCRVLGNPAYTAYTTTPAKDRQSAKPAQPDHRNSSRPGCRKNRGEGLLPF